MPDKKLPSIRIQSLVVLGLLLLLLLLAAVESVNLTTNYALTKQNEENRSRYMQVTNNFQNYSGAIDTLMTSLSFESSVQQVVTSNRLYGTITGWNKFMLTLFSYSLLESGIDSVVVTDETGKTYNYQYYQDMNTFEAAVAYAAAHDGYSPGFTLGDQRMFTISCPIYRMSISQYARRSNETPKIGNCIFFMDMDQIPAALGWDSVASTHAMCLLDAQGSIIAQNREMPAYMLDFIAENYPISKADGSEYLDKLTHEGSSYAVYGNQLGESGWTLICFSSTDIWSGEIAGILTRMIITWLVVILLTLALTTYLFQNIYGFIAHIQKHMRLVRDGNMEEKMPVWKRREFAAVSNGFNEMMERVNSLTRQNLEIQAALYQEELDKKRVALVALQSQVNPHFLYNTLDCMKSIGLCSSVREIPIICESLAQLMRYSIKGGALTTLEQELKIVQSYLSIQNIRFDGRYRLILNVPDACRQACVLKMMLQPIVENSVLHGFEMNETPGTIWIQAQNLENGGLALSVRDDGCGMDAEKLKELTGRMEASGSEPPFAETGIGLPNLLKRMRLYYGEAGSLVLKSTAFQGTVIEIVLPAEPRAFMTHDG